MAVLIKGVFQASWQGGGGKQEREDEESEQGCDLGQSPTENDLRLILQVIWSLHYATESLLLRLESCEKWAGGCVVKGHALKKEAWWCWTGKHTQGGVPASRNSEIGSGGSG